MPSCRRQLNIAFINEWKAVVVAASIEAAVEASEATAVQLYRGGNNVHAVSLF